MRSTLLLLLLATGCGGSALSHHASAAEASRELNRGAVEALETQCHARVTAAAEDTTVDVDQAEARAREILEACEHAERVQHAFAAALDVWVGALLAAVANEDGFDTNASLDLARRAFIFYDDIQEAASRAGVALPEVPPIIARFIDRGAP